MSSFIKGTSIYAIGNIFVQLINFILIPIYINNLNIDDFGLISTLEVVFFISNIFFTMSLERSAQRFYFEKDEKYGEKVFSIVFYLLVLFGIIILSISYLLQFFNVIDKYINIEVFSKNIFFILIGSFFYGFSTLSLIKLQVKEKIPLYAVFQFLKGILLIISTYYFIVYSQEGIVGYVYSLILTYGFLFFISILIIKPRMKFFIIPIGHFKELLSFSIPYIPTLLSVWIFTMAGRLILGKYTTLEDVALYSMAFKISMASILITSSIIAYVTPKVYSSLSSSSNYSFVEKLAEVSYYIFAFMFLGIFSFLEDVYIYVLTPEYLDSLVYVIPLLVLNYISSCLGVSTNLYFSFYKYNKQLMYIYVITSVVYIVLSIVLIKYFVIWSVVISAVVSTLLMLVLQYLFLRNKNKINIDISKVLKNSLILFILGYFIVKINSYLLINFGLFFSGIKILIALVLIKYLFKYIKSNNL